MNAWLIYGEEESIKNQWYIEEYKKAGKKYGVTIELLIAEKIEFGVENGTCFIRYQKEEIKKPAFAIVRTIYPLLNLQLESMGIPTFNNSKVAAICNDKARTYQYVSSLHIPMVDTTFCRARELEKILQEDKGGKVIKSVAGHGGAEVFLSSEKERIAERIHSDFVLQPLVGSRHQDLRVYILGKEILGCILRTAREGFKSNFSLGGEVREYVLTQEQEDIVSRIVSLFEFGLVGIDFIVGDDGTLLFNEIEDVVGARMLYQCKIVNLPEKYIEYIINSITMS